MISNLSIRNFAIIDQLDIEFGSGLIALTGETGAGKSILIGALNAILGGRTGAEVVRAGAAKATIDAWFDIAGSPHVTQILLAMGFEPEEDRILLSREIAHGGKSTARIGGRPATIGQLKEIGEWLVDLHGQHEHQSLLVVARHVDLLDEWAGRDLLALREQVAEALSRVREHEKEIALIARDARERERLLDLYRFQSEEISGAALSEGEEEDLRTASKRLANAQRLAETTGAAAAALNGDDGALLPDTLASALRQIELAASMDDTLSPLSERVTAAISELQEAAHDLSRYQDDIEANPERLEQIEERLETIRTLKRKYGDTIADILAFGSDASARLEAMEISEERAIELGGQLETARAQLQKLCAELSDVRRARALGFQQTVEAELCDLGMERTRFAALIEPIEPTAKGTDRVEFVIAPNPGEPLRPLAKIASGGEISRVMLAIKAAMALNDPLPTMVFDEIDVGVGGRTAAVIGEKMALLGKSSQILCITHLAHIASRATHHLYIEKQVEVDRTHSRIRELTGPDRIDELARMIGGAEITEAVRRHATEMLQIG